MSVSRSTRMPRRALAVVAAALVTVTLSACDPKEAGSAAVVGGYRISESQVQDQASQVIDGLHALGGQAPESGALLTSLVGRLVGQRLVDVAGAREDIVITQGQIDSLIEKSGGRKALEDKFLQNPGSWAPSSSLDAQARVFLIQTALAEKIAPGNTAGAAPAVTKYLADLAKSEGVEISPRYGTWDASKISLGPVSDDLSRAVGTAPTPSASPIS